ncbi:MAG TPA: FMN-binding protein, partial [Bacillota bacterium]|nr:FMN-binding protein [Bacillota bacterium]
MNTTVKMIVVLGLISAISAGLLAGVNMLTADTIKANSEKRLYETLAQVIEADEFEAQEGTEFPLWLAKTNGEVVGYVVRLTGHGYSSDGIDLLVGLDAQATVKGVLVFSHSETPGLGSKVAEQSYLAQFVGKGLDSAFVPGEDVDAISGATSSSMAVIGSVRKAVDFVGKYAGLTEETGIDFANIPDGEYVGKGRGFGGDITVKLTFAGGKLTALEIVSHNESPNVSDPA